MNKVTGITLIEVMIGLTLGLLMSAGTLQIFIQNKKSHNIEQAMITLSDNHRFLSHRLQHTIRLAGHRSTPDDTHFTSLSTLYAINTAVAGTNNQGLNNSDTLIVRYQGSGNGAGSADGSVRDCLNVGVDSHDVVTNTFSLNQNGELTCRAQNTTLSTDNTMVLMDNVESFQVLYGEDVDANGIAERYVPASYATLDMSRVVSIRIGVLLHSDEGMSPITDTSTYYILNEYYDPSDDRRYRQPFESTIQLRNMVN